MNHGTPKLNDFASVDQALRVLCAGFCDHGLSQGGCTPVEPARLPKPYARLLVHHDHMTKRLEAFHGRPVDLHVLDHRRDGDLYRRKIVLTLRDTDRVVEFGVVRLHLGFTEPSVRDRILERQTPLGDILIQHGVLRRIEPRWYLRFSGPCPLLADVHGRPPAETYGRIGTIYCNGAPAIELLEIVTGVESAGATEGWGTGKKNECRMKNV